MYPLKFRPVFQQRIWGGKKIRAVLGKAVGKELENARLGESWELADLPAGTVTGDSAGGRADGSLSSVVANGALAGRTLRQLLEERPADIMGEARLHHGYFPLLVKFLDAQLDLSVQVHPDADFCAANPDAHLKSEAWYIMHAEPGAKIYHGIRSGVTRAQFRTALEKGDVERLLHAVKVRAGDCYYLESGTVHALGAGILAAEVQTPSDTTFRVFDWNRLGGDGKARSLHIEQAMACIQFEDSGAVSPPNTAGQTDPAGEAALVDCDYFSMRKIHLDPGSEREMKHCGPLVWIVLEGQGILQCEDAGPTAFTRGDTLLVPANLKNGYVRTVTPSAWLEVRLPGPPTELPKERRAIQGNVRAV